MTESPDSNYTSIRSKMFFSLAYTYMVIGWNNAEEAAREILTSLSKGGIGATIAIRQLGNVSLSDALRTVCGMMEGFDFDLARLQADHINHFREGMDILREHRNFYVHNLRSVHGSETSERGAVGSLYGMEVKGGYKYVTHTLHYEELHEFTQACLHLKEYGEEIARHVADPMNALAERPRMPLASLEKPRWPERLKKTRKNLLERPPPPESSQG